MVKGKKKRKRGTKKDRINVGKMVKGKNKRLKRNQEG